MATVVPLAESRRDGDSVLARKADDLGTLTEDMAARILQAVGTNDTRRLDAVERLHVLYAVLDRCEATGGQVTF